MCVYEIESYPLNSYKMISQTKPLRKNNASLLKSKKMLLTNFRIPGSQRKPGDLYLTISEDKITDLSIYPPLNEPAVTIDCEGCYLSPGLVDLQLYGAEGKVFGDSFSVADFMTIDQAHLRHGTTRYLMTLYSTTIENIYKAIDITKEILEKQTTGCVGLHLEGPYLNLVKAGGHQAEFLKSPTIDEIRSILDYGKGVIKMWTIAPELFDEETLAFLLQSGITISAGHSNATATEAKKIFKKGIRMTTHLYNAMSGMHHRTPGLVGATLVDDRINTSIIADGHHVDFDMLKLAWQQKKNKLILISDATFLNVNSSEVQLQNQNIHQKDGAFYNQNNQLVGSAISLLEAVQNLVRYLQIPIPEAIDMASRRPADLLRAWDYGQLAKGKTADILLLDKKLEIIKIIRGGKIVS